MCYNSYTFSYFINVEMVLTLELLAQANPSVLVNHVTIFWPALAECLKDGNIPVRLAAERCALHSFQLARGICFCYIFVYVNSEDFSCLHVV